MATVAAAKPLTWQEKTAIDIEYGFYRAFAGFKRYCVYDTRSLVGTVASVACFVQGFFRSSNPIIAGLQVGLQIAAFIGAFFANRDPIIRCFSRREWLTQPFSLLSKVQGIFQRIFTPDRSLRPQMDSRQSELPSRSVPPLDKTKAKYLASIQPLLPQEAWAQKKAQWDQFVASKDGLVIQKSLEVGAAFSRNWLEQPWRDYAYLHGRLPLHHSSSWYGMDALIPRTIEGTEHPNITRTVSALKHTQRYVQMIRNNTLPQEAKIPFCMDQYNRLFGVARVPGKGQDHLEEHPESRHIVVHANDNYYVLPLFDEQDRPMPEKELYQRLYAIKTSKAPEGAPVNLLTMLPREEWAEHHEELKKANKETLEAVESALLVLILSDEEAPKGMSAQARHALCNTRGKWVDKFCIEIHGDGVMTALVEHTVSDATIQAAFLQYMLKQEETADGHKKNEARVLCMTPSYPDAELTSTFVAKPLVWQAPTQELQQAMVVSTRNHEEAIGDMEIDVRFHQYGKDYIKQQKLSPDSWVQMALQLAYWRLTDTLPLTYESASTRLFYHGRTETIRSVSNLSREWVESMGNGKQTTVQRQKKLRSAIQHHVEWKHDAMLGEGLDRHLMGLYMTARYLRQGIEANAKAQAEVVEQIGQVSSKEEKGPLVAELDRLKKEAVELEKNCKISEMPQVLKELFDMRFALATSQTPFRKGAGGGLGGGFLPIWDAEKGKIPNGAGVSYRVDDEAIVVHVTGFASANSGKFSTEAYAKAIQQALTDMHELMRAEEKK